MAQEADSPVTQSDESLTEAVRSGDADAFRVLFERHRPFAERLAQSYAPDSDADDDVAEVFLAIYTRLRSGTGPTDDFRAYLRRVIVNESIDRYRHADRTFVDENIEDRLEPSPDHTGPWFESTTIVRAYRSLPAHWQRVLWQVDVEGQPVRDVARSEGTSPARLSKTAYRARRALRAAYLAECLRPLQTTDAACRNVRRLLPDDVRGAVTRRQGERVQHHLDECRECREVRAELVRLDQQLEAWFLPAAAGVGGLGLATTGAATTGTVTAGIAGVATLPVIGLVTAGVLTGGLIAGGLIADGVTAGGIATTSPEAKRSTPFADHLRSPTFTAAAADSPDRAEGTARDSSARAGSPTAPSEENQPAETASPAGRDTDWLGDAPRVGDRVSVGTDAPYRARSIRHETEVTRGEERELPPLPGNAAPGTTVWEREYSEVTVNRYFVESVYDDEADRWEILCDGTRQERTMRSVVEETVTTRHRAGYRVASDGSRVPVRQAEVIDRSVVVEAVLGNPPMLCPPDPEDDAADDSVSGAPVAAELPEADQDKPADHHDHGEDDQPLEPVGVGLDPMPLSPELVAGDHEDGVPDQAADRGEQEE